MSIHTTRANLKATDTKVVLERYNDLATDLKRPTLKAWKGSKDVLIERVLKLMQEAADAVEADAPAAEAPAPKSTPVDIFGEADKAAAQRAPKTSKAKAPKKPVKAAKKAKAAPATGDSFTLADLARDLKINPKVARAKARRHKLKADADGWTFNAARRDEVTSILKGAK